MSFVTKPSVMSNGFSVQTLFSKVVFKIFVTVISFNYAIKKKKSEIISAVWKIINAVQKSYKVIGSDVFGTWFSCYDNVVQFRWFCDFKQNLKSENAENIFLFKSFFFLVVYLVSLVMHYIAVNSDSCSYLLEGCSENNIKLIFLTTNPKTFLTCILSLLIQKCWS